MGEGGSRGTAAECAEGSHQGLAGGKDSKRPCLVSGQKVCRALQKAFGLPDSAEGWSYVWRFGLDNNGGPLGHGRQPPGEVRSTDGGSVGRRVLLGPGRALGAESGVAR